MSFRKGRYKARKKLERMILERRVTDAIMSTVSGSVFVSPGAKVAVAKSVARQPREEKVPLLQRILSGIGLG